MLSGPLPPLPAFAAAAGGAGFAPPAVGPGATAWPLAGAAMATVAGFSAGALTADLTHPSTDVPPMTGARTRDHCPRVSRTSTSVLPSKVPRTLASGLGPSHRSVPLPTIPARATAAGDPPAVGASAPAPASGPGADRVGG